MTESGESGLPGLTARAKRALLVGVGLAVVGVVALVVTFKTKSPGRPAVVSQPEPGRMSYFYPQDEARRHPSGIGNLPDPAEARRRVGYDGPGTEVAVWIDEVNPLHLFIAVRPEEDVGDGQILARVAGNLVGFEPCGETSGGERPIYAVGLEHSGWPRAILSANLYIRHLDESTTPVGPRDDDGNVPAITWRGDDAPPAPPTAATLIGTLREELAPSAALGVYRRVSVYLPPGHDPDAPPNGPRPAVVYLGDGEFVPRLARIVEPMILAGQVRPVALVGAHPADAIARPPSLRGQSGGPAPIAPHPFAGDPRAAEYVEPSPALRAGDPDGQAIHEHMFDRHFRFFADDLRGWAETTLGVSSEPNERVLTGFSSGAALAVSVVQRRPGEYGGVIAVSFVGTRAPAVIAVKPDVPMTKFLLCGGWWEGATRGVTDGKLRPLVEAGAEVRHMAIIGGHDPAIWDLAVVEGLIWMLPPRAGATSLPTSR